MQTIPLEIIPLEKDGYHIIIDVELLSQTFKMVLDTGASKSVLDKETLFASGLSTSQLEETNILSTGLGTNEMESHSVLIDTFKIDLWEVKNIHMAVLDLSTINYAYRQMNLEPVVGVLGGDILFQYGAIINYKKKTLRLNNKKIKGANIK